METENRGLKILFAIGLIAIFIYLIVSMNIFSKESLKEIFMSARHDKSFGVFFTILIALLMVFFVPISWFSALGAFFFGLKGFLYVITAGMIAAVLSFYIAKVFRRDVIKIVNKIYYRKERDISLEQVSGQIEEHGMGYVFFMRSMPFIPFSIANYVSGLSSIGLRAYIIGTFLGLAPGQFATTYFFYKAVDIRENPVGALIAGGIKAAYVALVILWQRKSKYKTKE
ncbi:MAG: TVP38/TMEM64 family protein [Tissierellia bacterium]|nr:TVP38/TMEM64 family protein [Tissierellia bacterium]